MSNICPNCGNSVPDGNLFCQTCGTNLSSIVRIKSTELSLGEKMYVGILAFSLGLEAILFAFGSGGFTNPFYFIAPFLLGFLKQEPFIEFGNLSKPFKKLILVLLLLFIGLFIWELRLGDPLRDAIIFILGPLILLMILIMIFVVNFVFYTIGHVLYNILH